MSASLMLAAVRHKDETIPWIEIKSKLQPLNSWGVSWTNRAMTKLNQNSSHLWTKGANLGLMGRTLDKWGDE